MLFHQPSLDYVLAVEGSQCVGSNLSQISQIAICTLISDIESNVTDVTEAMLSFNELNVFESQHYCDDGWGGMCHFQDIFSYILDNMLCFAVRFLLLAKNHSKIVS